MSKVRVLGVDPGTARVGYGIVDWVDGAYVPVDYGCICTDKDLPDEKRLEIIYQALGDIVDLHAPTDAAVESLFFNKNLKTAISVSQARGVILLLLANKGIVISSYTPLQIKQGIAAYGRADKVGIQMMVTQLLGLDEIPQPDDAADGLAVAICHGHMLQSALFQAGAKKVSRGRLR